MPTVPRYDNFQATPNTLPQARLNAPVVQDVAGQQAQQLGAAMTNFGQHMGNIALDMQREADRVRIDDAINQAQEARIDLTYGKDIGFANLNGRAALERPDGKPLDEEYTEKLKSRLNDISAGLGNDAQRQAFTMRSRELLTSFRGQTLQHFIAQSGKVADDTDTATIENRKSLIGLEFSNPKAIDEAINGRFAEINGQQVLTDKGIKQAVYDQAKRNGRPAEWAEMEIRKQVSGAYSTVVMQMLDADPFAAKAFMDAHAKDFDYKDAQTLRRALDPVLTRRKGEAAGESIYKGGGPAGFGFGDAVNWVLHQEGGYVTDDAGKGETNFGINKTANPDIDVAKLTPEKAREIYRSRYWNAIGADKLPPEMRAIAFDAAVNQGVGKAKELIGKADGDPQRLIDLRREEYQKLIAANPAKYGKFEKSWSNRLNQLEASIGTGSRTLSGMLEQADTIADPDERKVAKAAIKSRFELDELATAENYQKTLVAAQSAAFSAPGGWRNIPAAQWTALKPEDRAKLMAGPPKQSDPDTLFFLQNNPGKWRKGEIEHYRPLLTESDFRTFYDKGNAPDSQKKILAATIDAEQFNNELTKAGLGDLLKDNRRDDTKKATLYELRAKFEQVIDVEQQAKGRQLSMDEKNALLVRLIKPVKVSMVRSGSLFGWFDGAAAPEERRAFQVQNPTNIAIPEATRERIRTDMQKRGITPTADRVLSAYLAMEEPKK